MIFLIICYILLTFRFLLFILSLMLRVDFKCPKCKNVYEDIVSVDNIMSYCPICSTKSERVFSGYLKPIVKKGYPYYNVSLGKTVHSKGEEDREFDKLGAVKV